MRHQPELARLPRLIDLDEAVRLSLENCKIEPGYEDVDLEAALGRILAEDLSAKADNPPFDLAFYDGYAIRSEDTKGASWERVVKLRLVGRMETTGRPGDLRIGPGEAAYTPCGAPLPVGADSVVRVESAIVDGDTLILKREVRPHENVTIKGDDYKAGQILLPKGGPIRPQDLGLAMELGRSRLRVFRRPKVGVIPVGSDLIERSRSGVPYPDSYSRVAMILLRSIGADSKLYPIVPDDPGAIEASLLESIGESDMVLLIGGASVARNDVVPDIVSGLGRLLFHGVRVSPGKVSGLAIIDKKPVFLVPAHIGSTFACLLLFVIPSLVHGLTGIEDPYMKIMARLTSDIERRSAKHAFRTLSLSYRDGEYEATPVRKRLGGSSAMTTLTLADGFVVVGPEDRASKGDRLVIRLFPHGHKWLG